MGLWEFMAIAVIAQAISGIIRSKHKSGKGVIEAGEIDELHRRIDDQAESIADAHAQIASYNSQVEELHERLEFTERLLSQVRDRPELSAGPDA